MPPATGRPTILVDTYNVLHVTGVLPPELAGPSPRDLAVLIAQSRWGHRDAWLVCDGAPPGSRKSGGVIRQRVPGVDRVTLVFAGPGRDADSAIERHIERDSAPKSLLVVSSDRRILKAARKRRAITLTSESFLERLAQDHAHPPNPAGAYPEFALDVPLDPSEAARWRERLGLTGYDLPASPDPLRSPVTPPSTPPPASPRGSAPDPPTTNNPSPADDPLIREALREWDGLNVDDLDMRRWLGDEPA